MHVTSDVRSTYSSEWSVPILATLRYNGCRVCGVCVLVKIWRQKNWFTRTFLNSLMTVITKFICGENHLRICIESSSHMYMLYEQGKWRLSYSYSNWISSQLEVQSPTTYTSYHSSCPLLPPTHTIYFPTAHVPYFITFRCLIYTLDIPITNFQYLSPSYMYSHTKHSQCPCLMITHALFSYSHQQPTPRPSHRPCLYLYSINNQHLDFSHHPCPLLTLSSTHPLL